MIGQCGHDELPSSPTAPLAALSARAASCLLGGNPASALTGVLSQAECCLTLASPSRLRLSGRVLLLCSLLTSSEPGLSWSFSSVDCLALGASSLQEVRVSSIIHADMSIKC